MRKVKCPYCGNEMKLACSDDYARGKSIITCDVDDSNGCDKDFVLVKEVTVNFYALKIEGVK